MVPNPKQLSIQLFQVNGIGIMRYKSGYHHRWHQENKSSTPVSEKPVIPILCHTQCLTLTLVTGYKKFSFPPPPPPPPPPDTIKDWNNITKADASTLESFWSCLPKSLLSSLRVCPCPTVTMLMMARAVLVGVCWIGLVRYMNSRWNTQNSMFAQGFLLLHNP